MNWIKPICATAAAVLLALFLTPQARADTTGAAAISYTAAPTASGGTEVQLQETAEGTFLFLPASADLEHLSLVFDGAFGTLSGALGEAEITPNEPFSLTALASANGDGAYAVALETENAAVSFFIMRSERLCSLHLTSADPEKGRSWVELDKGNKSKAAAVLLGQDGEPQFDGAVKSLKGRGHSTWNYPKRPYQMKLEERADLLGTGEPEKTWVLLANYVDPSLLRNTLTYAIADALQLSYSPHSMQVDLYYDGEYRGVYQLCEKTEIGKNRVNIRDLEGEIADANPEVGDFDDLPRVIQQGVDHLSYQSYQYVSGLALPEDYTGGYLLELDYPDRARMEASWFQTLSGAFVVCNSPEYLPEAGIQYIQSRYQQFENALYHGGVDPETGNKLEELMDLDSLVRCYLILELAGDNDAFASSTFFYKPAGDAPLYAGPVWDFDTGYGLNGMPVQGYVAGNTGYGAALLQIPTFREAVRERYLEEFSPLLRERVLGQGPDSLTVWGEELSAAARMDGKLWGTEPESGDAYGVAALEDWLRTRMSWMDAALGDADTGSRWPLFADVAPGAWYSDAVTAATERGLFVRNTLFHPETVMSRGMCVTVLHRLAGTPAAEALAFSDVERFDWYAEAAAWAAETGLAEGYGEGVFGPNDPVTREQFAAMLYRCAALLGVTPEPEGFLEAFSDRDNVSGFAMDAVRWAVGVGLLQGMNRETLSPGGGVTRAQAAAMLTRFVDFLESQDH